MKRFIYTLLIIMVAFLTKPLWDEPIRNMIPESVSDQFDSMKEFTTQLIDDNFNRGEIHEKISIPDIFILKSDQLPEQEPVEKPELSTPTERIFSVGNIKLGDSKDQVNELYGEAMRESKNEYGLMWFTYHEDYQNFIMVTYEDDIVRGLFTNQDMFASQFDIVLGDSKLNVNEALGEPEELIHYEKFGFQIESEGEYDVYKLDGSYATIFYDLHEGERVTAIQLIDENLEMIKHELYSSSSDALREGFEYQLFDLINATRIKHGQSILEWEDQVREPARAHSTDMADNHFFSHTNLQNQTLSDRLNEAGISFTLAGENLAYGQFSSIFAHLGLMNSAGHRENILQPGFTKLGVGVAFNEDNHPFYTEKYLTN